MNYPELVKFHGASNYWRLGEISGLTAVDVIGGANGTISGGVSLNQPGALADSNPAMTFNGTTGQIQTVAATPAVVTVEAWIKNTAVPAAGIYFFSTRSASPSGDWVILGLNTATGKLIAFVQSQLNGVIVLTTNVWYHVACVLNGTTATLYVNGQVDITAAQSRTTPSSGAATIGIDIQQPATSWNGSLDEVAIYPRALTPQEIKDHYVTALTGNFIQTIQLISLGPSALMSQSQVYALPASPHYILSEAILQYSPTVDGAYTDLVNSNVEPGVLKTGGGFIKSASQTNVVAKKVSNLGRYASQVIKDGASNYWRLDETSGAVARDIVGGANGTISGGVTLAEPGAIANGDKAMTFDGTTGKIVTPGLTMPTAMTVEAWMKCSSTSAQHPVLATGVVSPGLYSGIFSQRPFVYCGGPASGTVIVTNGSWHHVVYVLDGSTVTFYVDGQFDSTVARSHTAGGTGAGAIGWSSDTSEFFPGSLDEVAIYPRALTAQEILAHYSVGKR